MDVYRRQQKVHVAYPKLLGHYGFIIIVVDLLNSLYDLRSIL